MSSGRVAHAATAWLAAGGLSDHDAAGTDEADLGELGGEGSVAAFVARVVHALAENCATIRIIVTSREPLGVPGEGIWRVPSLSAPARSAASSVEELAAPDAVRLFMDRATAARPNLCLDPSTAPYVAAICARLDGIPLALELAAARVRCHLIGSRPGWMTCSVCSPAGRGRCWPGSRRCWRPSTGATICSTTRSGRCCAGWQSSPRRSRWTPPKPSLPTGRRWKGGECSIS